LSPYFEDMNLVLFDGVTIKAGSWLDVDILGFHLTVPPFDVPLLPKVSIPFGWFWDILKSILDKWAEEYYAEKGKE